MAFIFETPDSAAQTVADRLNVTSDISVSFHHTPGKPLRVRRDGRKATVCYGRRVELFRGLGLIAQYSEKQTFDIEQSPRFTMNGVMLDCSRNGVMLLEQVKNLVVYMATMGLDTLMLYTEDTYEVPGYPYFGYMRGRYSQEELREMDGFCAQFGITLIPCIQTLAHLNQALRWQSFDDVRDYGDILLCGEEKTYALIESMLRSCRDSFRTDRIHIGMDEAFMMGYGQYRMKNKLENQADIFCRHLERVVRLCEKYGFRPMIWSDMFFRQANGGEYYGTAPIDERITKMVPTNVELVYWDYYSPDKAHYRAMLDAHSTFENPTLFAGAAWRWIGYAPALEKSFLHTRCALDACLEKKVEQVFMTAWGDDGNEASFFTALPVMQLYAEYSYCGGATNEELDARLQACTGQHLGDMLLLDLPNRPDGKLPLDVAANPSKYLLYQDIMTGLYRCHSYPSAPAHYADYAAKLADAAQRVGTYGYIYDTLAKLCAVLEIKSTITDELCRAYHENDRAKLTQIAAEKLPALLKRAEAFHKAVQYQWDQENKVFGYEVLDLRLGGLEARIASAMHRLNGYLSGKLTCLPELEEPALQIERGKTPEDQDICQPFWARICSASRM